MGLDITAHSKLTPKTKAKVDGGGFPTDGSIWVRHNPDFPAHAADIKDGYYKAGRKSVCFRAGSYSGYYWWRNELAVLAGFDSAEEIWESRGKMEGPFTELINFSDCDGIIGPGVSAKLAGDFDEFQAKADAHPEESFRTVYAEFREAFKLAAGGGAVFFH